MIAKGKVIKYGNNVDTDVIIPARHLNTTNEKDLALHCMEDLDKSFPDRVKAGHKIIVAGRNFGCGSSREHAPAAIKASGVSCVIAKDFARIFYRNAINIGLPILECPAAVEGCSDGDELAVDLDGGIIENLTTGAKYSASPFPGFLQDIIASGGLMKAAEKLVAGK